MNTLLFVLFALVASVVAAPVDEPAHVAKSGPDHSPAHDSAHAPAAVLATGPVPHHQGADSGPVNKVAARSADAVAPKEPIAILSQESEVNPDGSYVNKFETANGISVAEEGSSKTLEQGEVVQVVKGVIAFPAPDGTIIETTYTADENGFHPSGAHLPVGPEIPAYIARSLEWSAAHPEENEEVVIVEKKL